MKVEARVRIPFHCSDRCEHGRQAQKSYSKFKLKLRIERSHVFRFFILMKLVFIQITQAWEHYFKSFNRVQSIQNEKARFIKGNELKLSFFHPFFLREYVYTYFFSLIILNFSFDKLQIHYRSSSGRVYFYIEYYVFQFSLLIILLQDYFI